MRGMVPQPVERLPMQIQGSKPTLAAGERRRSPRGPIEAPVAITVGDRTLPGKVVNLSYAGAMVDLGGEMPAVGDPCGVTLHLPGGDVDARARVVRLEAKTSRFAIELEHVDTNGDVLLATILLAGVVS